MKQGTFFLVYFILIADNVMYLVRYMTEITLGVSILSVYTTEIHALLYHSFPRCFMFERWVKGV